MEETPLVAIEFKLKRFIESRRDFIGAFQLDLNTDRITTTMIWDTVKKCRAMGNLVSKYLADTEILERQLSMSAKMSQEALDDAVVTWIKNQPVECLKRFDAAERRRVALMENQVLRTEAASWAAMVSDIGAFKKTLVLAMENIRGARKDILGALGSARLDGTWEPGKMGKEINLIHEALESERRY